MAMHACQNTICNSFSYCEHAKEHSYSETCESDFPFCTPCRMKSNNHEIQFFYKDTEKTVPQNIADGLFIMNNTVWTDIFEIDYEPRSFRECIEEKTDIEWRVI